MSEDKVMKVREGFLAPNTGQELRWLILKRWAFGFGVANMFELFEAIKNDDFKCGHRFKFVFTAHTKEDFLGVLPGLLEDLETGRTKKMSGLEKELTKPLKALLERPVIDRSLTLEGEHKLKRAFNR